MTLRDATITTTEGEIELIEFLKPTRDELVEVLADHSDASQALLTAHNAICDDWDGDPADTVAELPQFVFADWNEWILETTSLTPDSIATAIMANRTAEYVHHSRSTPYATFHTVACLK